MVETHSKQYFEEVSQDWESMGAGFFGEAPRKTIHELVDWQSGMNVADIGTGSGYLLEGLSEDMSLHAVDQSPKMLDVVTDKLAGYPSLTTQVGTSEALGLTDDSMDIVMANMYLHHVERPGPAIKEMVRILKPGGTLVFTDLDKHTHQALLEEHNDRWMGFERADITQWLDEAGLKEVEVDCVGSDCSCTSDKGTDISISIFVAKGIK